LQYDSSSHGANDYRALAREVLEMSPPSVAVSLGPVVMAAKAAAMAG
jgi:hypothetical protein